MKKVLALVLVIGVALLNVQTTAVLASEVAYAAEKAEAQSMVGAMNTGTTNDSFYTIIGSGFLGLGKEIRSISQEMLGKIQQPSEPKALITPESIMKPTAIVPEEQPISGKGIIAPVTAPVAPTAEEIVEKVIDFQKEVIEKEKVALQEEPVVTPPQEKEAVKEEALYLPIAATGSGELGGLLEGEIAGATFLGLSATSYKILGAAIAITGITFLILGTSGAFDSGGTGSGGTDLNGGSTPPPAGGGDGDPDDEGSNGSPVVPEASTIYLIVTGLCGLFTFRRFRF